MKKNIFDGEEIYCRKLGHFVNFKYCKTERSFEKKLPCPKIMNCWYGKIPIEKYIEKFYNKEEIKYIFEDSKPKIASLIEIIEKAKKIKDEI